MSHVSSALFAVSASLDALLTGILFGIRKIRITFMHNLCISTITLLGSFLAIWLGNLIPFFATTVFSTPKGAACVGCAILLGMGVYYVMKALVTWRKISMQQSSSQEPQVCEFDADAPDPKPLTATSATGISTAVAPDTSQSSTEPSITGLSNTDASEACTTLTPTKLFLLGIALSANNMGIGIGAGMAGLPLVSTCFFTLLFSVFFLHLGNCLGRLQKLRIEEHFADLLCGLLLIILGICQLL